MTMGFIYILRPRIQVSGQEVIKIGMTTRSVAQRVKELTTGSPSGFDILYSIQVDNARWFEKTLHTKYENFRLKGGGQEFFRIPAKVVIAEIEKIATNISRSRARAARDSEMENYKKEIGAAAVDFKLKLPLIILFPFAWWYAYYFIVVKFAMVAFPHADWPGILIALASIYFLPVGIWKVGKIFYKQLYEKFVWSRFGARIEAKNNGLKAKYPLAYA